MSAEGDVPGLLKAMNRAPATIEPTRESSLLATGTTGVVTGNIGSDATDPPFSIRALSDSDGALWGGTNGHPVFSPDGSKLAFLSMRRGGEICSAFVRVFMCVHVRRCGVYACVE